MKITDKMEEWMQSHKKILTCVCMLILAMLPFLHVNSGVEFSDTGYSLGNYENFAQAEGTWALATFLANVTGWLFTKLPFGHTMLGMQVYCNALLSVILLLSFWGLKKYFPARYVFIGEILAWSLCWCPRVILYNYMTYLFFALGCLILLQAIKSQKKRYFYLAGILLGVSLFVRFSNLTQAALIVIVVYDAILRRKSAKSTWQCIGICISGYFTAVLAILGGIALFYGASEYFVMIKSLFAMENTESSYSLISMITAPLQVYFSQLKWLWVIPVAIGVGIFLYRFCKKGIIKYVFTTVFVTVMLGIVLVYYKLGVFWRDYNSYGSFVIWAVAFLLFTLGLAVFVMLSKVAGQFEKCFACMVIVIILITPLGSNNALYPVYNNLFLVAPFSFAMGMKYIGNKSAEWLYPLKIALSVFCTVLLVQSFLFGWVFTFRDAGFTTGIDTTITQNRVLRGMRTTSERAEWIEELSVYIYENDLCGRKVLLYGEIPFASYALEMPSALSSSWPDLNTVLNRDEMMAEIDAMEEEPVVIIAADYYNDLLHHPNTGNEKALLIAAYMQEHNYQETFRNEKFVVYLPQ